MYFYNHFKQENTLYFVAISNVLTANGNIVQNNFKYYLKQTKAQSAEVCVCVCGGVVEYTDCIFADG